MNKIIAISPSGNFYGSEQVLFDYLSRSMLALDIAVPSNSAFENILRKLGPRIQIRGFKITEVKRLYAFIFLALLRGKYDAVYLNEAGHVKYILFLSKFFRRKKFVIHVRIWEDTERGRWIFKPGKNVKVLAISQNIQEKLPIPSVLLYDPFIFIGPTLPKAAFSENRIFNVAIIGRITYTKGIYRLADILRSIKNAGLDGQFHFYLYGDAVADVVDKDWFNCIKNSSQVTLMGFTEKVGIYKQADAVMHLNAEEPLGRIFLEAINEELPFIGINGAGIGEIGNLTGQTELLVSPQAENLADEFVLKLKKVRDNYIYYSKLAAEQKEIGRNIFNIERYCKVIDDLLHT